jgi:hypothetical protein
MNDIAGMMFGQLKAWEFIWHKNARMAAAYLDKALSAGDRAAFADLCEKAKAHWNQ